MYHYRHRQVLIISIFTLSILGMWFFTTALCWFSSSFRKYYPNVIAINIFITYLAVLFCYISISPHLWKLRAKKAILNFFILMILFILIELPAMLSWFDYRVFFAPRKMPGGIGPHNRQIEPTLYFHRPAYDKFSRALPGDSVLTLGAESKKVYKAVYIYDQNGFRNDRNFTHAAIVLLGDSFVEGYKVTQGKIISTQLSKFLGVDVYNLGQCDYGPENEMVVMKLFGLSLQPSVIVWFFCEGNDLYDYEKAIESWDEYVYKYNSFKARSFVKNFLMYMDLQTKLIYRRMMNRAIRRSATLLSQSEDFGATMYFEFEPIKLTKKRLSQLEKFQEMILEAKSICDQKNIFLLCVHIPIKFRIYHNLVSFTKESSMFHWSLSEIPERLARDFEANGIPYLDLTPVLRKAAEKGKLVYFLDDAHWTTEGHEEVARKISEFISEKGWLKDSSL